MAPVDIAKGIVASRNIANLREHRGGSVSTGEKLWPLKFTFSGRVWLSVVSATHFRKRFSNKELMSKNSLRGLLDAQKAIANQFQRAFETELIVAISAPHPDAA